MEEKEQFRKEMMQRLIPERDTNVHTQASGKQSQKNQGRPTVAQTRTSGLRNRTNGVEAKVNTGLRKPTSQKENTAIKTSVSIFLLWLREGNQVYFHLSFYLLVKRRKSSVLSFIILLARLESAYSLIWGSRRILDRTLALI